MFNLQGKDNIFFRVEIKNAKLVELGKRHPLEN